jgi:hypothetical protein
MRTPRMTKQHFKVVAGAIADALNYLENEASWLDENERVTARQVAWTVAQFIAGELSKTNPLFSYVRFYDACGLRK